MLPQVQFGPGEATQHSRHNITQHVSRLKSKLMRRDGMQLRCHGTRCDAMQWSLERQTDGAQAHTLTHLQLPHGHKHEQTWRSCDCG